MALVSAAVSLNHRRLTLASFIYFSANLYDFVYMLLAKCFEDDDCLALEEVSNSKGYPRTFRIMPLLRKDSQAQ